jgi:hypothetical protein
MARELHVKISSDIHILTILYEKSHGLFGARVDAY